MKSFLKFETAIICDNDFSESNIKNIFECFSEKGFKKFIFLLDFDFDNKLPKDGVEKIKNIRKRIFSLKPRALRAEIFFNFTFSTELADNPYLLKMNNKRNLLFLTLPPFYDNEEINAVLNNLLYKQKFTPVFTSFDRNIKTCSNEYLQNFVFKPTAGIFAMDFRYLASNFYCANKSILKAVQEKIHIVPCFSLPLFYYADYEASLNDFQKYNSNEFCIELSRLIHISFNLFK